MAVLPFNVPEPCTRYAVAVELHQWKTSGPQVRDDGILTYDNLARSIRDLLLAHTHHGECTYV